MHYLLTLEISALLLTDHVSSKTYYILDQTFIILEDIVKEQEHKSCAMNGGHLA